jgi:hypothetical protein
MSSDQSNNASFEALDLISGQFERLNDFERALTAEGRFDELKSGTDLRRYETGWALEKWIEATLDRAQGFVACWWLEITRRDNKWKISARTSIAYTDYDKEVESRMASTINELKLALTTVVDSLIATYGEATPFREQIDQLIKS